MKCDFVFNISTISNKGAEQVGKFDWGVRYVIIFQYVQFWIRLPAVSYRGKTIRTLVSPAVRSVNKTHDTKLGPKGARRCDLCPFRHSFILQSPTNNLCALMWQISLNYNRLEDDHCDDTGHRKMSALGMGGNEKEWWNSHYGVVDNLNLISNLSLISYWSVHSGSYFSHSTGTFAVSTDSPLHR